MASVRGDNGDNPRLTGTNGQDDIDGNGGDDVLFGFDSNDELFGGNGDDVLSGGEGDDILRGQNGSDDLIGGPDNDVLYGLGNQQSRGEAVQDIASDMIELPFLDLDMFEDNPLLGPIIPPSAVPAPDTLTGGEGNDLFYIQQTSADAGFGFVPGQQYAIITDFGNVEGTNDDQIRLPGSNENYIARGYDLDGDGSNDSTAIIYTEDPNIEIGAGISPIPIGDISVGRTLEIESENALVALVENASIRNLTNDDFYTYG